jgi:hypothetical protein
MITKQFINERFFNTLVKKNSIIIDHKYNQPITSNIFPNTLTHLTFGDSFNQPITSNIFPDKLTHLDLGDSFDKQLSLNNLPPNLVKHKLGLEFNKYISRNIFSSTLEHIVILKETSFYRQRFDPINNKNISQIFPI